MSTTIGPDGSLIWDYPQEYEANQELTTSPGDKAAGVAVENALGESSKAGASFRLVTGIPLAPTNVRAGMV